MAPVNLHELTAAYSLDAVDPEEARAYEAHLGECERCRRELAALRETAGELAWGSEAPAPPARLRASILARAAAEHQNLVPLPVTRTRLFRAVAAAAAVAACAAVALAVWAVTLSRSLDHERSAKRSAASAAAVLADPSSRRVRLPGGRGQIAVDPLGRAVLVVRHLPPPPAGRTYEAWVIPPGSRPIPAGLFSGGNAIAVVGLQTSVPRGATVAATVEPSGGSPAPTTRPILSAHL